jgi:hypothetical protein
MRWIALLLLAGGLSATEIPQGAHVALSMVNSVSTRTAREGDYVYMRTATPIAADGHVVVPVGSYVQGVVTSSKRSGRVKGRAELAIRLENLTLPSGKMVRIAPKLESVDSNGTDQKTTQEGAIKQGGSKGTDAARVAKLGGTGAAIGGLSDDSWKAAGIGAGIGGGVGLATVLLTRGREVTLRRGETVDVVFQRPVPVE